MKRTSLLLGRVLPVLFFPASWGSGLPAQAPAAPPRAGTAPSSTLASTLGVDRDSPLGKALASFDARRYRKELLWWACDERDGREPGTRGAREARQWTLARFREFGLKPMGEVVGGERTYLQVFPIHDPRRNRIDPAKALFRLGRRKLTFLKEWAFLGGRRWADVKGASLVSAGYGLEDQDMVRAGVKGKVVLAWEGAPGKPVDLVRDARPKWLPRLLAKARRAARFGALALILAPPPGKERPLFTDHQDLVSWSSWGCPVVQISQGAAQELREGLSWDEDHKSGRSKEIGVTLRFSAHREREGRNLIGLWPGSDPRLRNQFVVIGAHRDHIGIGAYGSRARRQRGEIHNGADDNASGSVGVVEIARALARAGYHPKRSLLFVLFDAEEMGLLGSRWWVNHPTVPLKKVAAMINMDMIGRVRDQRCQVLGTSTSPAWEEALKPALEHSHLDWRILPWGMGGSDHLPFVSARIPAIFFHSGLHPDYHTPQDDPEKCNPQGAVEVLKVVLYTADRIACAPQAPEFAGSGGEPSPRRRPRLGVLMKQTSKGPVIRKVLRGSLAEKLGLRKGDAILSIGGGKVRRISQVFRRLRLAWRRGKVEISWFREGEEMSASAPVDPEE